MGEHIVNLVYCPILKKEIDNNDDCFIIASVAEKSMPKYFSSVEI